MGMEGDEAHRIHNRKNYGCDLGKRRKIQMTGLNGKFKWKTSITIFAYAING